MEIKGIDRDLKEEIIKKELVKLFPALCKKDFKISWLCPSYFRHKKKYRSNGYFPTENHRVSPQGAIIKIGEIEALETIETYGTGAIDGRSHTNTFYMVDPDYAGDPPYRSMAEIGQGLFI